MAEPPIEITWLKPAQTAIAPDGGKNTIHSDTHIQAYETLATRSELKHTFDFDASLYERSFDPQKLSEEVNKKIAEINAEHQRQNNETYEQFKGHYLNNAEEADSFIQRIQHLNDQQRESTIMTAVSDFMNNPEQPAEGVLLILDSLPQDVQTFVRGNIHRFREPLVHGLDKNLELIDKSIPQLSTFLKRMNYLIDHQYLTRDGYGVDSLQFVAEISMADIEKKTLAERLASLEMDPREIAFLSAKLESLGIRHDNAEKFGKPEEFKWEYAFDISSTLTKNMSEMTQAMDFSEIADKMAKSTNLLGQILDVPVGLKLYDEPKAQMLAFTLNEYFNRINEKIPGYTDFNTVVDGMYAVLESMKSHDLIRSTDFRNYETRLIWADEKWRRDHGKPIPDPVTHHNEVRKRRIDAAKTVNQLQQMTQDYPTDGSQWDAEINQATQKLISDRIAQIYTIAGGDYAI